MDTKAQAAAKAALSKFNADLSYKLKYTGSQGYYYYSLDQVEAAFTKDRKIAKELVKSCGVEESEYVSFEKHGLEAIYTAAGARKEFVWQAKFAMKYGL